MSSQDRCMQEDVALRKQRKEAEAARFRALCNGTRTVQDLAARMGWSRTKVRQSLKVLGLSAKEE